MGGKNSTRSCGDTTTYYNEQAEKHRFLCKREDLTLSKAYHDGKLTSYEHLICEDTLETAVSVLNEERENLEQGLFEYNLTPLRNMEYKELIRYRTDLEKVLNQLHDNYQTYDAKIVTISEDSERIINKLKDKLQEEGSYLTNEIYDSETDNFTLSDKFKESCRLKLIESNLRLVRKEAKKFNIYFSCDNRDNGSLVVDLLQEGCIGLMKAVDKFEYKVGVRLSTYATWWIKKEISKYIKENEHTVKLPQYLQERVFKINKINSEFLKLYAREATEHELSDRIGINEEEIIFARGSASNFYVNPSLDTPIDGEDEDLTMLSVLPQKFFPSPDAICCNIERRAKILKLLESLTEREAKIISKRVGLEDGLFYDVDSTLQELGDAEKLTRERIRQIEAKALSKLRNGECAEQLEEMWAD